MPYTIISTLSFHFRSSPLPAGRQTARTFTPSNSEMHPADQSLDDVICAKGCVNTIHDLGLRFVNRAGEQRRGLCGVAGSLLLNDCYDNLRYLSLTSGPSYAALTTRLPSSLSHCQTLRSPLIHSSTFDIEILIFSFVLLLPSLHVPSALLLPFSQSMFFFLDSSPACPLSFLIFSAAVFHCFLAVVCPVMHFISSRGQHK